MTPASKRPWKSNKAGDNLYIYVDVPSEHWPTHEVIANMDDDCGKAKENAKIILNAVNRAELVEEMVSLLGEAYKYLDPTAKYSETLHNRMVDLLRRLSEGEASHD